MSARVALSSMVVGAGIALAGACSDAALAEPCSDIPPGGCPLSRGVACDDPACEAVYACRPGNVWELEQRCQGRDAGASRDGAAPEDGGPSRPPFDASIDAPAGAFGGPGCDSLQLPDCALGVVLGCSGCCGCEDLFVCEENGWTLWGSCGEGGPRPDP